MKLDLHIGRFSHNSKVESQEFFANRLMKTLKRKNIGNSFFRIHFLLVLFCPLLFFSCKDEFTTDNSCRLSFSVDTVRFDTIFTDYLMPTQAIMIYNHTEKNLRIKECKISNNYGCFKVNLDGRSGNTFNDIEISSGDSLFLFIQARIPETGQDAPLFIEESIVFNYNDNVDKVTLIAYGQDVHKFNNDSIKGSSTWVNDKPYLIYNDLTVAESATLTIEEGVTIYMHDKAEIIVDGTLLCKGSRNAPITVRGDRTDNITANTLYDQINGQWNGLFFKNTSKGNQLQYTQIRNGKYGIVIDSAEVGAIDTMTPRLIIGNSHIHNVSQNALNAYCATVYAYNTLFTCGENGCVVLQGGTYVFNHCTITDYGCGAGKYAFATVLSDKKLFSYESQSSPLSALFTNCIVYGPKINELYFESEEEDEQFRFLFDHCLLRYNGYQEKFMNGKYFNTPIWNESPDFKVVNVKERRYDFHIDSLSGARNKGTTEILSIFPECQTDKDGNMRTADSLPDIGAYQWAVAKSDTMRH